MICDNCKTGADLGTRVRTHSASQGVSIALISTVLGPKKILAAALAGDPSAFALTYTNTADPWRFATTVVAKLHTMCTGCDCQHKPMSVTP